MLAYILNKGRYLTKKKRQTDKYLWAINGIGRVSNTSKSKITQKSSDLNARCNNYTEVPRKGVTTSRQYNCKMQRKS